MNVKSSPLLPWPLPCRGSDSLLRRRRAGVIRRQPDEIKQIEFDGEPLDMACVLRWRRRILAEAAPQI